VEVKRKMVGSMALGVAQWKSNQLPFIRCNFPFSPEGHSSLLVFTINRTIGLLCEVSLSHPL
jgi:hypothetical protein